MIKVKKILIWIILAIILGYFLAKFTFKKYDDLNIKNMIKIDNSIYALKCGIYSNIDEMKSNLSSFGRYIYIKKNDKYNAYIAIAKTKKSCNKFLEIYKDDFKNLNVEKINIDNDEFIQNINEYEKLLNESNDKDALITIENQILSCYEKLVVKLE